MHDFRQYLKDGEEILYEANAVPNTGDKSITGELFLIGFSAFCMALMILSVVYGIGDGADGISLGFIIIFAVLLLFGGLGVYNIIYKLFLKKHLVKDDHFCITNLRAMKYEDKKQILTCMPLETIEHIEVINYKKKYGDLYMQKDVEEVEDAGEQIKILRDAFKNKDTNNMTFLHFESIEDPYRVAKILKEAKDKLKNN